MQRRRSVFPDDFRPHLSFSGLLSFTHLLAVFSPAFYVGESAK